MNALALMMQMATSSAAVAPPLHLRSGAGPIVDASSSLDDNEVGTEGHVGAIVVDHDAVMDAISMLHHQMGAIIFLPTNDDRFHDHVHHNQQQPCTPPGYQQMNPDAAQAIDHVGDAHLVSRTPMQFHGRSHHASTNARKLEEDNGGANDEAYIFAVNITGVLVCLLYVAIIAGLFLGYLTLDAFELRILQRGSLDENERMYAGSIIPVVEDRHRVLVTLLVLNSLGYEALPLFLDNLVPSWVAVILSVTLVLLFGEIIPSGIFMGPRQLYLGHKMVPIMRFLLWLCHPVTYPMVLLLDHLVEGGDGPDSNGDGGAGGGNLASADEEGYHRNELSALIRIQHENDLEKQYGAIINQKTGGGGASGNGNQKKTKSADSRLSVGKRGFAAAIQKRHAHQSRTKLWTLSNQSTPNWSEVKAEIMDKSREMHLQMANRDANATASANMNARIVAGISSGLIGGGGGSTVGGDDGTVSNWDEESAAVATAPSVDQIAPPLHRTEVDVIEGALRMKTSVAMDVYTPLSKVHSIPSDLILDKRAVTMIYGQGFSRLPVYRRVSSPESSTSKTASMSMRSDETEKADMLEDKSQLYGFLMTRQLMLVDWDDKRELSTLSLQRPTCVSPKINLVDLLRIVQTEGKLMTFVCARPDLANIALEMEEAIPPEAGFMGIVTLEDIIESILQDRIYDEEDIKDRDRSVATLQRWAATKLQGFYRRKSAAAAAAAAGGVKPAPKSRPQEDTNTAAKDTTAHRKNTTSGATVHKNDKEDEDGQGGDEMMKVRFRMDTVHETRALSNDNHGNGDGGDESRALLH